MPELAASLDLAQGCAVSAYKLLHARHPELVENQLRFELRHLTRVLVDVCNSQSAPQRAVSVLDVVLRNHALPSKRATTDEMAQWRGAVQADVGAILGSAGEALAMAAV